MASNPDIRRSPACSQVLDILIWYFGRKAQFSFLAARQSTKKTQDLSMQEKFPAVIGDIIRRVTHPIWTCCFQSKNVGLELHFSPP